VTSLTAPGAVVIGVDTHKHVHVAVAITTLGERLGSIEVPTTAAGLDELTAWARTHGEVTAWGIEGTGMWGKGLNWAIAATGARVVEVNRPNRQARRALGGKNDVIDAEAAARSVLSGFATATPKSGVGTVEAIRVTRSVRASAVKAKTAAMNELRAHIVTAPAALRDELETLTSMALIKRCAGFRPGPADHLKTVLRLLARRWQHLNVEARDLERTLVELVTAAAPGLLDQFGVGPDSAAALLITAGDNPERITTPAKFAALCGTNPIPASSGMTDRHRLNRGGDRQANAALYRIIIVRLRYDPETQAYMAARLNANGSNKKHLIRCLKRALTRRLYREIIAASVHPEPTALAA